MKTSFALLCLCATIHVCIVTAGSRKCTCTFEDNQEDFCSENYPRDSPESSSESPETTYPDLNCPKKICGWCEKNAYYRKYKNVCVKCCGGSVGYTKEKPHDDDK